ncbi:hypothetical protein QBC40DRAFT_300898 [Triangularia verruculosa]|uniref:Uncharacterized protein n=1 Tax=Triangularia verruculosa TaxID=2587418 RepID=A0AAN6XA15_9PEZI|nr:hypothetical protein QBC40DRAFT_300898 [Triangularia verruculosa]
MLKISITWPSWHLCEVAFEISRAWVREMTRLPLSRADNGRETRVVMDLPADAVGDEKVTFGDFGSRIQACFPAEKGKCTAMSGRTEHAVERRRAVWHTNKQSITRLGALVHVLAASPTPMRREALRERDLARAWHLEVVAVHLNFVPNAIQTPFCIKPPQFGPSTTIHLLKQWATATAKPALTSLHALKRSRDNDLKDHQGACASYLILHTSDFPKWIVMDSRFDAPPSGPLKAFISHQRYKLAASP